MNITAQVAADELRLFSPAYMALETALAAAREDANNYPHDPRKPISHEGRLAVFIAEGLHALMTRASALADELAITEATRRNEQARVEEAETQALEMAS